MKPVVSTVFLLQRNEQNEQIVVSTVSVTASDTFFIDHLQPGMYDARRIDSREGIDSGVRRPRMGDTAGGWGGDTLLTECVGCKPLGISNPCEEASNDGSEDAVCPVCFPSGRGGQKGLKVGRGCTSRSFGSFSDPLCIPKSTYCS